MTLSIHDAVALLREARGGFSSIDEVAVEHECDCPPEWPRCGLCRIRQMASRLERRINAALVESANAATPVVEPAAEWWEERIFRANYKARRITVLSAGPHRWYWTVTFDDHPRGKHGVVDSWSDIAKTEEAAKAAAFKHARETP
jgi:hypothetical protein